MARVNSSIYIDTFTLLVEVLRASPLQWLNCPYNGNWRKEATLWSPLQHLQYQYFVSFFFFLPYLNDNVHCIIVTKCFNIMNHVYVFYFFWPFFDGVKNDMHVCVCLYNATYFWSRFITSHKLTLANGVVTTI
jgi:hypothetical protein